MRSLILALVLITLASFGMTSLADAHGYDGPHSHYPLRDPDDWGLWGVSDGNARVWARLMEANPKIPDDRHMLPGYPVNIPQGIVMTEDGRAVFEDEAEVFGSEPSDLTSRKPATADSAQIAFARMAERQSKLANLLVWILVAFAFLLLILALALISRGNGIRRRDDEIARMQEAQNGLIEQGRQAEREVQRLRIERDVYSGPPVNPAGILSGAMAAQHFISWYRSNFPNPVGAARLVRLDRVAPVSVTNRMRVRFGDGSLQPKNPIDPRPAWRAYFTDGTTCISLLSCANDVVGMVGNEQIPESQIIPRAGEIYHCNELVWPELANQTVTTPAPDAPVSAAVPVTPVSEAATASPTATAAPATMPAVPLGSRMFVIMGDTAIYRHPGDMGFRMVSISGLDILPGERGLTLRRDGSEIVLGTDAASDDRRAKVDEIVSHAGGSAS